MTVRDEIKNGLEYYRYTFLNEIPKIYANLEKQLEARFGKSIQVPPLLRVGSWIGGDRDGNPFVTHDVMLDAVQQHSALALEHYLKETHTLGTRLSLTDRLVDVSDELRNLADASPDKDPDRQDEPYRRALILIYSRLSATAKQLGHEILRMDAGGDRCATLCHTTGIHRRSGYADRLAVQSWRGVSGTRTPRQSAPCGEVFGFHLAPLDMRQHSAIHEQTVSELFSHSSGKANYKDLDEATRRKVLLAALQPDRPLIADLEQYSRRRAKRTAHHAGRRTNSSALRPRRTAQPHHLHDRCRQRHAGTRADAATGRTCWKAAERPALHVNIIPLFETIEDSARLRQHHGRAVFDSVLPQTAGQPRQHAGSDAGLFRQQQGRRLSHRQLGAVQGRARTGEGVREARHRTAPVPRAWRHRRARWRPELRRDSGAAAGQRERADPHHRTRAK